MLFMMAVEQFLQYLDSIERSGETVRSYREHLKAFAAYMERKYNGPSYLTDVTTEDIEDYLTYLKEVRHYAPASRAHVLNAIRSFYNYATKRELVVRNVALAVEPIKVRRKERTYLSGEEVEQLITQIEHPLIQLVTRFLYMTGLRISECLALTLDTVDLENKRIYVIAGKGNKDRIVPMSDKLCEMLTRYVRYERPNVPSNRFFVTERSGQLSRTYVNRMLNEAAKRLGWSKRITAHVLRHSFASELLRNGVGLVEVQRLLGHASLAVTSIYTHSNLDDLTKAVNKL